MMRNICGFLFFFVFSLLAGCQTSQPGAFFKPQLNDDSISTSVQETFMNHPSLSEFRLHVETKNSVVYLSGYVKTIRQSDTAGELASQVPGVKTVENNIIVRK